jgi:hypothetical protein
MSRATSPAAFGSPMNCMPIRCAIALGRARSRILVKPAVASRLDLSATSADLGAESEYA